ncbi:MAG: hypothetical protein A3H33_11335 [Betaproteobacteria bacterium RIFCSPLOWO2_02_FULL_65_20]|nr:MAG: hypothetical protein A3H33_11335 [Betaproteobacteria bacterium RIFCSPLOWO2_02_FULL_65_20]
MKNLPPELIYGLIFAALLLFQYMVKRSGRQAQQESTPDEDLPQVPEEVEEIRPAASVSRVTVGHFGRTEAPSASSRLAKRRFSRKSLMGTKREAQNAVVIAAILGPCRAYEPHDSR